MTPPVIPQADPFSLLAAARHSDPFSVLGPHFTDRGLAVRVLRLALARFYCLEVGPEALGFL